MCLGKVGVHETGPIGRKMQSDSDLQEASQHDWQDTVLA